MPQYLVAYLILCACPFALVAALGWIWRDHGSSYQDIYRK